MARSLLILGIQILLVYGIYGQSRLDYYVGQAVHNSPLVKDNQNQSQANLLEAQRLKAQYTKLQVSITGNYVFAPIINHDSAPPTLDPNPDAAEDYRGYDLAVSNGGLYSGLINFNQPLFSSQRYQAYAEQFVIAAEVSQNNARLSTHDLEKFVGDQYLLCLQDKHQLEFTDSLIQILKEQLKVIDVLSRSGLTKQSDITLVNIELQTQLSSRNLYMTTYKRDLLDLNVLCGISDTTLQFLPDIEIPISSDTIVSRYLFKYRLDSATIAAQQNIFELKYKPLLSAFANGGLNAVYAPTIPNRLGMEAGLTLTWNIFDGHQRSINQRKTNVLIQTVGAYKSYFLRQNNVRKDRILLELKGLDQRFSILTAQLQEYKKLLKYYKQELAQGQLPVMAYINVLKNMTTQQRDLLLLKTNRQLLINMFNYWNW